MDDKYQLPLNLRQQTVAEQIQESQRIIYRNELENLSFKANNDRHKQTEVATNNTMLKEKLDLLWEEMGRLNAEKPSEDSGGATQPRPTV